MHFYNMIYKEMEVYTDDMVVNSATREGCFEAVDKFLQWVMQYKLRFNPSKCLEGHLSYRGIEVYPTKVKVKLQYLSRFIARLTTIYESIFKLIRKNHPAKWNDEC